jgi:hypothetical protein
MDPNVTQAIAAQAVDSFFKSGWFNLVSALVTSALIAIPTIIFIRNTFIKQIDDIRNFIKEKVEEYKEVIKENKEEVLKYRKVYEDFTTSRELFDELKENYPIYKFFADNFSEDNSSIFEEIKFQLKYMKENYIKIYINGSEKDKAIEVIEYTEKILLEYLTNYYGEDSTSFSSMMLVYMKVLKELILDLVESLDVLGNKTLKASLISKYFLNLNKLTYYVKLKYPIFFELSDEAIIDELKKHFYSMDVGGRIIS